MDPVVELEHKIATLRAKQADRRCPPLRYWQLQDEIDVLNHQARVITAQQREEPAPASSSNQP